MANKALEAFSFDAPIQIEAAGDSKQPAKFTMVAYTGGPMFVAGFDLAVVVDLEGLRIPAGATPIRQDHDPLKGVGHSTEIDASHGTLDASGVISRGTAYARDVRESGINGFPWQASIGASVIDSEFIGEGETVTVNGRDVVGPVQVVRRSSLNEISFVDRGADPNTSAAIAAKKQETDIMADQKAIEAEAKKKADLEAAEQAEVKAAAEKAKLEAEKATETEKQIQASRKERADESRRVDAITKLCAGKHGELEAAAIEAGDSVEKVELAVLRAERPTASPAGKAVEASAGKVLEVVALRAASMDTSRLEKQYDEQTLDAADKMRGMGLQELMAQAAGRQLPRFKSNPQEFLQAAFSTGSVSNILSNVANKSILAGYSHVEDSWRQVGKIASVSDFKEHTRVRLTGDMTYEKVAPGGEIKHGEYADQAFTNQADMYAKMISITRQMIINDDLGAFGELGMQFGMGAGYAIAELFWGIWNGAETAGFFASANSNLAEGTATALSIDALTAAELLFLDQTKPNGKPLGIAPSILLVPNALKVLATSLMRTTGVNETTTDDTKSTNDNPHAGKFQVVSSSYMGNASITGYSTSAWNLVADPMRLPSIEVAFLDGKDTPTVETSRPNFNTAGIEMRGIIDMGVALQDPRGANKQTGEA